MSDESPGLATRSPVRVGIGLVCRRGDYLVRRRPPGTVLGGLWEFPGGKCEPGEDPADAASRESSEEIGMTVVVGRLRGRVVHDYPHCRVELSFFDCVLLDPSREPDPSTGFQWVPAHALPSLEFPEANTAIVEMLVRGAGSRREG